jgi:hypothetical protein
MTNPKGRWGVVSLVLLALAFIVPLTFAQDVPPPPQDYLGLWIPVVGDGIVNRNPEGIEFLGAFWYAPGTEVTLTPVPGVGFWFTGWSGDHVGDEEPLVVTINSDTTITATFERFWTLTVDVLPAPSGDVEVDGAVPGAYPAALEFLEGTPVDLTALPNAAWDFDRWTGDLTGTNTTGSVTMDGDKQVTAHFVLHEYTLDVYINGCGEVTKDPNQATYHYGDTVELSAAACTGWHFADWANDLTGGENPAVLTIDADKVVVGSFAQDEYVLDVNVVGQGTVTKDPDQFTYHYGDTVELCQEPDPCWEFAGWSGDASGTDTCTSVEMNGHRTVNATFVKIQYDVTTSVDPAGVGTVTGGGTYNCGDTATLEAAATDPCYVFDHWSGALTGSANPSSLTVDADKSVTAHFVKIQYDVTTSVDPAGVGTVSGGGTYNCGDTATLEAIATDAGYVFDHWSGALTGSSNPASLTVDADKSVTAHFVEPYETLCTTLTASEGGQWNMVSIPLNPVSAECPSSCWTEGQATISIDGSGTDSVGFGVDPDATDGNDIGIDVPKPPVAFPPYTYAYFALDSDRLGTNIKAPIACEESKSWTFRILDDGSEDQVALSWDVPAVEGATDCLQSVTLTDTVTGAQVDMQSVGTYTYTKSGNPETREFVVEVYCHCTAGSVFGEYIDPVYLYRFNGCTGGYDTIADGDVVPEQGYWLWVFEDNTTVCVTGYVVEEDVSFGLPCEGWYQISSPWEYPKLAIMFSDGTETKTWEQAVEAGWVENALWAYDPMAGEYLLINGGDTLDPWLAYWILTYENGITVTFEYASAGPALPMAAGIEPKASVTSLSPPAPPAAPTWRSANAVGGLVAYNEPNPVRDVHTTTFKVKGSVPIEAIRVEIFDQAGRLVFSEEEYGSELDWHTENNYGEYLANGVYLYRVSAKVGGQWAVVQIRKLAIVR